MRWQLNCIARRLPPALRIAATGIHEGKLQQAVHALKYARRVELGAPLGDRLIAALDTLNWTIDIDRSCATYTLRASENGGIINHNS